MLAERGVQHAAAEALLAKMVRSPFFMEWARSQFTSTEAGEMVTSTMSQALQRFEDEKVVESAHRKSIETLLEVEDAARYADVRWHLMEFQDAPLILGDMPVVAMDANGQFGSSLKFKKSEVWCSFLPVSPSRALVAVHGQRELAAINGQALARASAGLSIFGFFASSDSPRMQKLVQDIGSIEPLFETKNVDVMDDVLDEFELGDGD